MYHRNKIKQVSSLSKLCDKDNLILELISKNLSNNPNHKPQFDNTELTTSTVHQGTKITVQRKRERNTDFHKLSLTLDGRWEK